MEPCIGAGDRSVMVSGFWSCAGTGTRGLFLSIGIRFKSGLLWPFTAATFDWSAEKTLLERIAQELCQSARLAPSPLGNWIESDRYTARAVNRVGRVNRGVDGRIRDFKSCGGEIVCISVSNIYLFSFDSITIWI